MLCRLQTPLALLDRVKKNGGKEIRDVMSDWKFWIPTKKGQVTISSTLFASAICNSQGVVDVM